MEMKLNAIHFNNIKNGSKQYEARLFDEKRQKIKLLDIVKLIISSDLDIIGLQETSEAKLHKIKDFKMYNYVYNNTTAFLSKFPIIE